MFREEWLVYLDALNPNNPGETVRVQLLVDQREVSGIHGTPRRNNPAAGWLCVTLAGHRAGLAELILPQPAQPVGETVIVHEKEVREEPGTARDPVRSKSGTAARSPFIVMGCRLPSGHFRGWIPLSNRLKCSHRDSI